jgi:hypothetical protein
MIWRNARTLKFLSRLAALVVMLVAPAVARAQCALCQTTASNMDPAGVRYLNYAIVLLLAPPVVLFCAFIYATYKRRAAPEDEARREEDRHAARARKSRAEILARVRPSN